MICLQRFQPGRFLDQRPVAKNPRSSLLSKQSVQLETPFSSQRGSFVVKGTGGEICIQVPKFIPKPPIILPINQLLGLSNCTIPMKRCASPYVSRPAVCAACFVNELQNSPRSSLVQPYIAFLGSLDIESVGGTEF